MLRGYLPFRYTQCKKIFIGVDIEYKATFFSAPLKCPRCGGIRTKPLFSSSSSYKTIWEDIE